MTWYWYGARLLTALLTFLQTELIDIASKLSRSNGGGGAPQERFLGLTLFTDK